uniref:Uncharacterized protein n=1 Tax=Arundo donax TaxID=35708 RepID=A0A0A9AUP3_ARUDO
MLMHSNLAAKHDIHHLYGPLLLRCFHRSIVAKASD